MLFEKAAKSLEGGTLLEELGHQKRVLGVQSWRKCVTEVGPGCSELGSSSSLVLLTVFAAEDAPPQLLGPEPMPLPAARPLH